MLKPIPLLAAVALLSCPLAARAQEPAQAPAQPPDPLESARVRLGRFGFTPALRLSGGYDSNVTREPGAIADYEFVATPQVETWLTLGRLRLHTQHAFETFGYPEQEPTWTSNHFNGAEVTVEGSRLEPTLDYSHRDTYARPTGYEVNTRSRRIEDDAKGGVTWHALPEFDLSVSGRRQRTNWGAEAANQGSMLRETLNRTSTSGTVEVSYGVTPLTRVAARAERTSDRYDFSPARDSDLTQVLCGLSLDSPAFLSGSAMVGFANYSSPASGAAEYSGVIAAVNLLYANEARTLARFAYDRYPSVSYSANMGYYVLSSVSASLSQGIFQRWEVAAFGGRHVLDYSQAGLPGGADSNTTRTDVGGGLSFRPGPFVRVGFDLSRVVYRGGQAFTATRAIAYVVYGSDRLVRLDRPLPEER